MLVKIHIFRKIIRRVERDLARLSNYRNEHYDYLVSFLQIAFVVRVCASSQLRGFYFELGISHPSDLQRFHLKSEFRIV